MANFNYYWQPLWNNPGSGSYNNATATSSSPADLDPGATASTAAPSLSQPSCAVIQSAGNVASETGQAMDMYVKILNPANRKEYKMYTLRGLRREDIDCPTKLRQEIFTQCGESVVPKPPKMELGYFHKSKKVWLNNRLDLSDAWELVSRGENIVFWCVGVNASRCVDSESRKRTQDKQDSVSDEECEPQKKAKKTVKLSKQEERKAKAEEYETTLKEKHEGSYTRFQYKLWAEMLTAGVHDDINTPPAASMFSRENKRTQPKHTSNDVSSLGEAVSGMVGILTQALSPNLPPANRADKSGQTSNSTLSPMKSAELRSIYLKQMSELRQLYDNSVLKGMSQYIRT